jgi:hypothetical protein
MSNFSYENCKEKYLKAEFTYEKTIYHSGTLAGEKEVIYNFNMEEKGQFESVLEMTSIGEFITPDYIYSYFEELFKKEVFNAKVHSIWKKTDSALMQAKEKSQIRILKAMAIISMIGNERLKNTPAHLKAALLMDDVVFEQAMRFLQREHILSQRDTSEYVLLTANGVDVQKSVDTYVKSKAIKIDLGKMLNEICDSGFIFPREHNDKFSILRYFKKVYMDAKEFVALKNAEQLLTKYRYDGLIVYLVQDKATDKAQIESKIKAFSKHPQIIVCISDMIFESFSSCVNI